MQYYLLTLGCPKNEVDSDGMAALLQDAGYSSTAAPEDADVLVVNTCGFLEAAKEESIEHLQALAASKREGQFLIAAGCLVQRAADEIVQRVPDLDGLLGTRRWMEVVELVERLRGPATQREFARYQLLGDPDPGLVVANGGSAGPMRTAHVVGGSAYLKISDGCNAPCAFCTIPSFKGKLRSRSLPEVVDEAQALVTAGAHELIVIAQDTTDYGRDWGEPNSLPRLLAAICQRTPDLKWLRLMYAYPGHVSDALIEVMASHSQILHYLDIPVQHGDPRTLRRMRRPSNIDMVLRTIEKMRDAMPDMTFRTTFIVGYPGETDEEFQGLLHFVKEIEFDKVGAFTFSPEPGTPAAQLPDQVPERVKQQRYDQLMRLQQRISLRRNQAQLGRELDVLIEGEGEIEGSGEPVGLGRSYRDAPEVDGLVFLPGHHPMGSMVRARITGAMEYDLVGEPVEVVRDASASNDALVSTINLV